MGGGLNGVGTTGHTGTGAPYGAPAQPTIILVWLSVRHKKRRRRVTCRQYGYVSGFQSRHLNLQIRIKDTAISQ